MRLVVALAAAALVAVPSAGGATLRTLVISATWGPEPQPTAVLEQAFRETDAFLRQSSFGALGIEADVTPPIRGFVVPQSCFSGGTGPGLGALAAAAKGAAAGLGFDVAAYDRFVYVFPDPICGFGGLGVFQDVLVTGHLAVAWPAIVHELGHTLGLPHASGSACAPRPTVCQKIEYGDRFSLMGSGGADFSARDKVMLGWIPDVPRVAVPGRYTVGSPQEPGQLPKALVVEAAAGDYWIEDVRTLEPTLVIRLLRADDRRAGPNAHTIYLSSGPNRAAVPGVLRVRRAGEQLAVEWIDRDRPTKPGRIDLPKARRGSTTVVVWNAATDAGSGVAGYRVRVDGRLIERTEQTIATLPALRRGRHVVTITAVDRAGNASLPARARLRVR